MSSLPDGRAVVYCQGAFNTLNGKTAHGLVRFTRRYTIAGVIDSRYAGRDAGEVLDGRKSGIPIFPALEAAIAAEAANGRKCTHFVMGLAPDGGRLPKEGREAVRTAVLNGLNIDCGLHDFISGDAEIARLAQKHGVEIRDVRKPPSREALHFFCGKIESVTSFKVALLGTDSAVGKRTTAWLLAFALQKAGYKAEMIGTGQTAWMQGARYGIIMDSLVNDFVAGEIEHAVWSAWSEQQPDIIILEGQGSLLNPAYPGGFELLAAGRPDAVIMQHAPTRKEYDGFPGYTLHPVQKQIQAVEMISGKPVIAITLNHEGLEENEIQAACASLREETGLPVFDVLVEGADSLANELIKFKSAKR